jgi:polysaccharide export outer membrane protein
MTHAFHRTLAALAAAALAASAPAAQEQAAQPRPPQHGPAAAAAAAVAVPGDYVIGAEDVLAIMFWREKEMSAEVVVRPDGRISLPLLNDVQAAGFTPDQLRTAIMELASRYVEDPNATVVVKQINSRKVYITGAVEKPGTYPLTGQMTVLQLIAAAGGLREYADGDDISILRTSGGKSTSLRFNYDDVVKKRRFAQNIALMPGDTVVVP